MIPAKLTQNKIPVRRVKSIFKSKEVEQAFENWLSIGGGINPHPEDDRRFYRFAELFCINSESIDKDTFVQQCKKSTHTTQRLNRGICQEYYKKLMIIVDFINFQNKLK